MIKCPEHEKYMKSNYNRIRKQSKEGGGEGGKGGEKMGGKGRGARQRKFPGHTSQIAKRHC